MESQPKNDPFVIFEEFFMALQQQDIVKIHSVHLVGTALTDDFDDHISDINSIIVLPDMNMDFLRFLAPLGKKYKPKKIAAPLLMTPAYIASSLGTFPIEFLSYKLIHRTVYGPDILAKVSFQRENMQMQCMREVKSRLIWLRQGYLNSFGDRDLLVRRLADSIVGFFPLFRAILALNAQNVPKSCHKVVTGLQELCGVETAIFDKIFLLRHRKLNFNDQELINGFEDCYRATEKILEFINVPGK